MDATTRDVAAVAFLEWRTDEKKLAMRNYVSMMTIIAEHLEGGMAPLSLIGHMDDPKLRSSVRLFEHVSRVKGVEVNTLCRRLLAALQEEPSPEAAVCLSNGKVIKTKSRQIKCSSR